MSLGSRVPEQRLRPGPSGLTRAEVLASQRGRLGWAALRVVAELGYPPTTVGDITKRAQVSRRTFYELFASKEACFIEAFETTVGIVDNMLDDALVTARQSDWKKLVRKSLEAYLEMLRGEPALARAMHVEVLAAGPALVPHHARMKRVFANRMRGVHRVAVEQGALTNRPADGVFDFIIGGIDDRIRDCLQTADADHLPRLAPLLTATTIALLETA
ncbi:TetR/AcrR family transcriptional regulator [Antrihabitans sp. YC2-6]|uniref:TetR/AcrR family transcriptional regulator n=1 Tax=Antrihabitans sp. YC2-6 TaxID=2799498 RepID=UPI0018F466B2|nr:TetR/AcrR family transcriptional regulator [Antrihabitans sp. YC2-6]MBJ8345554.1 helix-turn-helix transcriptional regulator [Antrihabitans sp. YC2-6]